MNRLRSAVRCCARTTALLSVFGAISLMARADSFSLDMPLVQLQGPVLGQFQTFGGKIDLNSTTPVFTLTGANWVSGNLSSPCSLLSCSLLENFLGQGVYAGFSETVTVSFVRGQFHTSLSWVQVPEEGAVLEIAVIFLVLCFWTSANRQLFSRITLKNPALP